MYPLEFKRWVISELKASSQYSLESIYHNYDVLAKSGKLEESFKKWERAKNVLSEDGDGNIKFKKLFFGAR